MCGCVREAGRELRHGVVVGVCVCVVCTGLVQLGKCESG